MKKLKQAILLFVFFLATNFNQTLFSSTTSGSADQSFSAKISNFFGFSKKKDNKTQDTQSKKLNINNSKNNKRKDNTNKSKSPYFNQDWFNTSDKKDNKTQNKQGEKEDNLIKEVLDDIIIKEKKKEEEYERMINEEKKKEEEYERMINETLDDIGIDIDDPFKISIEESLRQQSYIVNNKATLRYKKRSRISKNVKRSSTRIYDPLKEMSLSRSSFEDKSESEDPESQDINTPLLSRSNSVSSKEEDTLGETGSVIDEVLESDMIFSDGDYDNKENEAGLNYFSSRPYKIVSKNNLNEEKEILNNKNQPHDAMDDKIDQSNNTPFTYLVTFTLIFGVLKTIQSKLSLTSVPQNEEIDTHVLATYGSPGGERA